MSERLQRAAEELREVLAEEIQKLKDPRLGFVTVTGVKVSPDLHKAWVYYTVLGEERDHRATAAALRSARSHLRAALGHQIRMKFTPELEFEEDASASSGDRVEELLRQIHGEEQAHEANPDAGPPDPDAPREEAS